MRFAMSRCFRTTNTTVVIAQLASSASTNTVHPEFTRLCIDVGAGSGMRETLEGTVRRGRAASGARAQPCSGLLLDAVLVLVTGLSDHTGSVVCTGGSRISL